MTIEFHDVIAASERIASELYDVPLVRAPFLEQRGQRVFLKCENFQRTRSFKFRGAFNRLLTLRSSSNESRVVTRSSGNFALGLACAGKILGFDVKVVMPANASRTKVERTRALGASVVLQGADTNEADACAALIAEHEGRRLISPYDDYAVMAGQGTVALEVTRRVRELDYFFCPVGGGGLLAACSVVLRHSSPTTRVLAVEPVGADDYAQSRRVGERVRIERADTVADGLRTLVVGEKTFPLLQTGVDDVVLVTDESIRMAMRTLEGELGMKVEPSGAASVAALLRSNLSEGATAVCVISGGNFEESPIADLSEVGSPSTERLADRLSLTL